MDWQSAVTHVLLIFLVGSVVLGIYVLLSGGNIDDEW